MSQYEERLKRVNEYMEQSNSAYLKCQEELNQHRRKYANEMQTRDNALSMLIEKSIDLKSAVMTIDEKANNYIVARNQKKGSKGRSIRRVNINDNVQELEL